MFKKIIVFLFIVSTTYLSAQDKKLDTIKDTNAEKAMVLIFKSDSIALSDSINTIILKKQLEDLRTNEYSKRRKLEEQLKVIARKDSLAKEKLNAEIEKLKKGTKGIPIVIHKDTLFRVYTKIGSLTALERAKLISVRLDKMYNQFYTKSDSLLVIDNGNNIGIFYKDELLISVTELDGLWFEQDKNTIANSYKAKIVNDISKYKKDKSFFKIFKEVGLALLVVLLQIVLIKIINYIFRAKVRRYIHSKKGIWFKGIQFKDYKIFDEKEQVKYVFLIVKGIRYAIIGILLYITIPLLFLIFPFTERFAHTMFGYVINPLKNILSSFVKYVPQLITVVVIIVITKYILKGIKFFAKEVEIGKLTIPGFYTDWARPTYNLVKVFVLAFMFVVIFPYLPGSDSNVFKGVSVFIGILFSLGSSTIVANMVAGLVITYMRPFRVNDQIKIGEVMGSVVEKTAFVTRILTPKKEYITIPNANILATNVINYSNSKDLGGVVFYTTITIGYDVPWPKVHELMIQAAKDTKAINLEKEPFVLQTSLDDFYVSYQINVHTFSPELRPKIQSELHQKIQDIFNENDIEIMSPHFRGERDASTPQVPPKK